MISESHKFIFIHIPKCAGTSIENALRKYCKRGFLGYDKNLKGFKQHANCEELLTHNHITTEVCNSFFKFAFVRNPWDRCVSQYIWRIKKGGNFVNGPANIKNGFSHPKFTQKFVRNDVTFRQFLEKDFPWQEMSFEQHMRPQVEFIYDCSKTKLDFVGKFENINNDFSYVCKKLIGESVELPHANKSSVGREYKQYYDSYTQDLVAELYHEDINEFNYTF